MDELIAKIQDSQKQYPGTSFRHEKFLEHYRQRLFSRKMYDANGKLIALGTSYARFGSDGLLMRMTGFFELV